VALDPRRTHVRGLGPIGNCESKTLVVTGLAYVQKLTLMKNTAIFFNSFRVL